MRRSTFYSLILVLMLLFVSRADATTDSVKIFPNPTGNLLRMDLSITQNATVSIEVIDMWGRVVVTFFKDKYLWKGKYQFTKDIFFDDFGNEMETRMYIIRIKIDSNLIASRIIYQKPQIPDLYFDNASAIRTDSSDCAYTVTYLPAYAKVCNFSIKNSQSADVNYSVDFPNMQAVFTYRFTKEDLAAGISELAFSIEDLAIENHFVKNNNCVENFSDRHVGLFATHSGGKPFIFNPNQELLFYTLTDLNGKIVFTGKSTDMFISILNEVAVSKAVYIISVKQQSGKTTREKILWQ